MGERTSVGAWLDKDWLEEWDDVAAQTQEHPYSRSQSIKEAMEMYQVIIETMDDLGWDVEMAEPSKRHTVRDALRTKDRIEAGDDES